MHGLEYCVANVSVAAGGDKEFSEYLGHRYGSNHAGDAPEYVQSRNHGSVKHEGKPDFTEHDLHYGCSECLYELIDICPEAVLVVVHFPLEELRFLERAVANHQ